jgi:hypothetical protein
MNTRTIPNKTIVFGLYGMCSKAVGRSTIAKRSSLPRGPFTSTPYDFAARCSAILTRNVVSETSMWVRSANDALSGVWITRLLNA